MRGRPLKKATEADAKITRQDVERAQDNWNKDAPPKYRKLLDAKEEERADQG